MCVYVCVYGVFEVSRLNNSKKRYRIFGPGFLSVPLWCVVGALLCHYVITPF
jgi:succinate dehydrogenase/fumarate reductase cytochrome b subunit